jgi:hypothetical protein
MSASRARAPCEDTGCAFVAHDTIEPLETWQRRKFTIQGRAISPEPVDLDD